MSPNNSICVLFIVLLSINTGCENDDKEFLYGQWVIDKAYHNNQPVIWDLNSNGIGFYQNDSCSLPAFGSKSTSYSDMKSGTWKLIKKDSSLFIHIETTNSIFNRAFKITNLNQSKGELHLGNYTKMTILSDSMKLKCTKVIHGIGWRK